MDIDGELIAAADDGDINKVKVFLDAKADIHALDDMPLRFTSYWGHLETVKVLLENKADIHAENDQALRWASNRGHLETVKFLLEHRANVNAEDNQALSFASENGFTEVVKILLEHKADINELHSSFIEKYMTVNKDNISYLLELDAITTLSQIKTFEYNKFIKIKLQIQDNINELLGKNVGSIVFQYY